jgi:pimeloyl-ACP methyl ester carboxylesterase
VKHFIAQGMLFVIIAAIVTLPAAFGSQASVIHRGEIGGAKFDILIPAKPNGRLVLLAHGYRGENLPLTAVFAVDQPFFASLIDDGWTFASTSYRRNGWIVGDAIEDLKAVRAEATKLLGHEPTQTIIVGESMGGLIAARASELDQKICNGALALGAAMGDGNDGLNYTPRVPILFLSNVNEEAGPKRYIARSGSLSHNAALWTVNREGHVNVNDDEEKKALLGLMAFIDTGIIASEKDATVDASRTDSVLSFEDGAAICSVVGVNPVYGNVVTDVIQKDLDRLGVKPHSSLLLTVRGRKQVVRIEEPGFSGSCVLGEMLAIYWVCSKGNDCGLKASMLYRTDEFLSDVSVVPAVMEHWDTIQLYPIIGPFPVIPIRPVNASRAAERGLSGD